MFERLSKTWISVAVAAVLVTGTAVAQEKPKQAKDLQEHELYTKVTQEKEPAKRLALLDEWKQKYADTDFKKERLIFYQETYRQMNNGPKMADAAEQILAIDPKDVNALYWRTLLVKSLPATPDNLDKGEKAAQGLAAAARPDSVPDATWKALNTSFNATDAMAFIAIQRKDLPGAVNHYKKALEINPNSAASSYALGTALLNQKNPDLYPEMLYHIARAIGVSGPGELAPAVKTQVQAFLKKTYVTFHGSEEGLNDVLDKAKAGPIPPAGWTIKTKHVIEQEAAEKLAKEDPQLALWKGIKDQLVGADAEKYWGELKGSAVPKLKGKVVSTKPEAKPKEIVVSIEKPEGEVTLVMGAAMPGKAEPGTAIEFEGVPSEFTKEPFMLKFDVEDKTKISGWPAAAPPVKKAPVAKKAVPKKK